MEAMIAACRNGDLRKAEALIVSNKGVVCARGKNAWTPLHWACYLNNWNLAKILIDNGANILSVNKFGESPLHYAAWKGDIHLVTYILDQMPLVCTSEANITSVNISSCNQSTPLHWSCAHNRPDVTGLLLRRYGDTIATNCKEKSGKTPIEVALYNKNMHSVALLLHHALDLPYVEKSTVHLDRQLLPTKRGKIQATSKIHETTRMLPVKLCRRMVSLRDLAGNTLLMWACAIGSLKLTQAIIAACSSMTGDWSVKAMNRAGDTAMKLAIKGGHDAVVDILRKSGFDDTIDAITVDSVSHVDCTCTGTDDNVAIETGCGQVSYSSKLTEENTSSSTELQVRKGCSMVSAALPEHQMNSDDRTSTINSRQSYVSFDEGQEDWDIVTLGDEIRVGNSDLLNLMDFDIDYDWQML